MPLTLNTINNQGSWNAIATALNLNFDQIIVELEKLTALVSRFAGYYATLQELIDKHPAPAPGSIAWAGTPYPGTVVVVGADGQWTDTGEAPDTGGLPADQLENSIQNIQNSMVSLQAALQNALNEASSARADASSALNTANAVQQTVKQLPAVHDELLRRIQGTSQHSDPVADPFRLLAQVNDIAELNSRLDAMHSVSASDGFEGTFRVRHGNDTYHIESHCLYYADDRWLQVIRGLLAPDSDGRSLVRSTSWNLLYRAFDGKAWSAWGAFATDTVVRQNVASLSASDAELLRRLQGVSEHSNASTDPFRLLATVTEVAEVNRLLDALHTTVPSEGKSGAFRILFGDVPLYVENAALHYASDEWLQAVRGRFSAATDGSELLLSTEFNFLWRRHSAAGWGAWQRIKADGVGRSTATGGEIFNDYAQNQAEENAHAEGVGTSAGVGGHAEGIHTVAGPSAHAEGTGTQAAGTAAHAEGEGCVAEGDYAHAEGFHTRAGGRASHAEGLFTVAQNAFEHAQGRFNHSNADTLFSVGIGTSDDKRRNAAEINNRGDAFLYGVGGYKGEPDSEAQSLQAVLAQLAEDASALLRRLQGTDKDSSPSADPFLQLGDFDTMEALFNALDNLHGTAQPERVAGVFRASCQGALFFISNLPVNALSDHYVQVLSGCLELNPEGSLIAASSYGRFFRSHRFQGQSWAWSAWERFATKADVDRIAGSVTGLSTKVADLNEAVGAITGDTATLPPSYIRNLGNFNTWAELLAVLDSLHADTPQSDSAGLFVLSYLGTQYTVRSIALDAYADSWLQVLSGALELTDDGSVRRTAAFGVVTRTHSRSQQGASWSPWSDYARSALVLY